jgi:hypothetical protein
MYNQLVFIAFFLTLSKKEKAVIITGNNDNIADVRTRKVKAVPK